MATAHSTTDVTRLDVVRLESGMTVAEARRRLDRAPADAAVLVHRTEIDGDAWYRFQRDRLADLIADAPPKEPLGRHITLDALNRVPVVDLAEVDDPATASGVLMVGPTMVGFALSPSTPGAPEPPRRGSGSVPDVPEPATDRPGGDDAHLPESSGAEYPGDVLESTGPASVDEGSAATEGTQTLSAFGAMEAPPVVGRDESFTVEISVVAEAAPGSTGGELVVPDVPAGAATISLGVQLVTGFEVTDGAGTYRTFDVDVAAASGGPVTFALKPGTLPASYDPDVGIWVERVLALFFHRGVPCGQVWREVRVNVSGDPVANVAAHRASQAGEASPVSPSTGNDELDLTVTLARSGGTAAGVYSLTMASRHFPAPAPVEVNVGDDSLGFATSLIRDIDQHLNDRTTDDVLAGIGEVIADALPTGFWDGLRTVWEAVAGDSVPADRRRPPTLLLLTEEPHVPWELAAVPEPFDPDAAPFLGAQVDMGRWPLDARAPAADPSPLATGAVGVVVGNYKDARGVRALPSALAEAEELSTRFRARSVDAAPEQLDLALKGRFGDGFTFDGLHFAGHGVNDPARGGAYLMLSNGRQISSYMFRAAKVAESGRAFLFLNACQVGTANQALGEYAGVAGFAVKAGFRGFIAPLWSVSDDLAREVSLGFYAASSQGGTVAGYLRESRRRFRETDSDDANATWLAYVYYGHPGLRLGGPPQTGGGG